MGKAHVTLTGRLGGDPDKKMIGETKLLKFSVATDSFAKGEKLTHWHNIDLWGQAAERLAPYLKKGTQVVVLGELISRQYEKDGVKMTAWSVRALNVDLIGGTKPVNHADQVAEDTANANVPDFNSDDEIPF